MAKRKEVQRTKAEHRAAVEKRAFAREDAERQAAAIRRAAQDIRQVSMQWQGQIPHPADLKAYDEVEPGTAKRLIDRFISQSEHREEIEKAIAQSNIERSSRGQIIGAAITLVAIGVFGFAIARGYGPEGVSAIFASLGLLASVFVYGNRTRRKELERKWSEVNRPLPDNGVDQQGRLF